MRFTNLNPLTTAISLRLPTSLPERIKLAANRRDVPDQSLIKVWLPEKLEGCEGRAPLRRVTSLDAFALG